MWFDSYNYAISKYDSSVYPNDINLILRGILIDTAPLFILVIGHYDEINNTHYVEKFQSKSEKEKNYKKYDYKFLLAFLNSFGLGKYSLYTSFKKKKYFKEYSIVCADCLLEKDFLDKKIEIPS